MKHKIIFIIILLYTTVSSYAQKNNLDSLLRAFKSKDFDEVVWSSKLELEKKQKEIIPALIQLLQSTEYAKLYYSNQLMYPGTKRVIFDYEKIIPYELDWISIRAGWLLEELTFMDFGFRSARIDNQLLEEIKKNNKIEDNEKIYTIDWQNRQTELQIMQSRKILAEKAANWWEQNKSSWTRVSALKTALQSNNEDCISKALNFMSDYSGEKNNCDNLYTLYKSEIRPHIILLKHSLIKSMPEKLEDYFYNERLLRD
ncbi:MAG: hypothetical protein WCP74_08675 [Sphingobacteriia bacterium]|jgi:hypothetical protein